MIKKWSVFAFLIALLLTGAGVPNAAHAQTAANLQTGSANGDVWDLQYRLKTLGYFQQPLDGIYGPQTSSSVVRFQKNYGLAADGKTDSQTWNALKKHSLNSSEMDIMARVIYSEARGESYMGQVAVGAVVMNRMQSNQFPGNIRGVVFQPGAFTAVADNQYWLKPNQTAYLAALDAVRGWDPTNHSLYYFNPNTATNKWIWTRPQTVKIGNHIFTK